MFAVESVIRLNARFEVIFIHYFIFVDMQQQAQMMMAKKKLLENQQQLKQKQLISMRRDNAADSIENCNCRP